MMNDYLKHVSVEIINSYAQTLYITADGCPNTDQPFTLTSRKPRDLFDVLRDPDGDAILNTVYMFNSWHGDSTYRTYLYQRRYIRSITFIEKYTTVSAAIAGHLRHRQGLWGY
jgi:hypothetical protein